ncbi:sodium-coupled monocarboxylate transporter 1-like [Acanthaster planci]|uniref:Sodium-coupled monocarboxylate transporter 1-like n=1 Tax=Acanthaster planci TaxID=133434 RepID=A0A8B7ZUS7_ACAPL|nr:sodium-coupled monocarboxylate transporter 1-like [Acanthaster planci]XP_022109170.1 sodium-coupled monocarboxylate transporter 1-like [Acanthaster planci]
MANMPESTPSGVFSVVDYAVFSAILLVSAVIGLYHACTGGHQRTTQEIFVGDRQMKFLPVGFSLLASWMSAVTLLGTPSECYSHGTMFWLISGSYIFVTLIAAHLYIPVFYRLGLTSVYEYLQLRFSHAAKLIGALAFIFHMIVYMSVVLYAPALAINAVTGFSIWKSILTVGLVCIFYTTLGGIKAVVWTDVFQTLVMFAGLLAVIIQGSIVFGGFQNIWQINQEGGRIVFNEFGFDPTIRHSLWSLVIGGTFTFLGNYGCNQLSVQRYLSCPSERDAKRVLYVNCPLLFIILSLTMMCGLVMYAMYGKCDPILAEYIGRADQLLPYYVVNELGFFSGLAGLFIGCIFSGSLSTVSSGMNSLAAVTLEDVLPKKRFSEKTAALVSKFLACTYGLLCVGLAYLAGYMGPVLEVALKLMGIIGGPLLGLFTLGLFFPCANNKGALVGVFTSFAISTWIAIGAFLYPTPRPGLLTTLDDCVLSNVTYTAFPDDNSTYMEGTSLSSLLSSTAEAPKATTHPVLASLYSVSYLWYSVISMLAVLIVGLITSLITGGNKDVDPSLLSPVVNCLCSCSFRRSGHKLQRLEDLDMMDVDTGSYWKRTPVNMDTHL